MSRSIGVTPWLQDNTPEGVLPLVEALTLGGDLTVLLVLLGAIAVVDFRRQLQETENSLVPPLLSQQTLVVIATGLGGLALIVFLETSIGAGRPPESWHKTTVSEYGFPSGHTMAATIVWGAVSLLYDRWRLRWRILGVTGIAMVVGVTRLILGVHYTVDILIAIILGWVYLGVMYRTTWEQPQRSFTVAISLGIAALLVTGGSQRGLLAVAGTVGGGICAVLTTYSGSRQWIGIMFFRLQRRLP